MKTKILLILLFLFSTNLLAYDKFVDPNPGDNDFGSDVIPLPTGNVLITAPCTKVDSINSGAVYLFNGKTGELISALYGAGGKYIQYVLLPNGNVVVYSPEWKINSTEWSGAVTCIDGKIGLSGKVDSTNSLIGANQYYGTGLLDIIVLKNGNYIIHINQYIPKDSKSEGIIIHCKSNELLKGSINQTNSLISKSQPGEMIKTSVYTLLNGNYVIMTFGQTNRNLFSKSITWCSGENGLTGEVSKNNSFYLTDSSEIGLYYRVLPLPNGNYLIFPDSGGGVTFCSGLKPMVGRVDSTNSLVGCTSYPKIWLLENSNYIVTVNDWNKKNNPNSYGSVTWGDGTKGVTGRISKENSLIGISGKDMLYDNIWDLRNGNYLVKSMIYNDSTKKSELSLTWCDGTKGLTGTIDSSNSLMNISDLINITNDGNYITLSEGKSAVPSIKNAFVTLCDGKKGLSGYASEKNSLVINKADSKNINLYEFANGNLVLSIPNWNEGRGAWKWLEKNDKFIGKVDTSTWLTGQEKNAISYSNIYNLYNGYYLIYCYNDTLYKGAITLFDDSKPLTGHIETYPHYKGNISCFYPFVNNKILIFNHSYKNNRGILSLFDFKKPINGEFNESNSLVGNSEGDIIGMEMHYHSPNTSYYLSRNTIAASEYLIINSPNYHNKYGVAVGAITMINSNNDISGIMDVSNSLIGVDSTKKIEPNYYKFANGNILLISPNYNNFRGAITLLNLKEGIFGHINEQNSILGKKDSDRIGEGYIMPFKVPGKECFLSVNKNFGRTATVAQGCVTFGNSVKECNGIISEQNSILAPIITTKDLNICGINFVETDTINKLIYISFKTENFVRVLGFDNNLEVLDTKPHAKDVKISPNPSSDQISVEFDLEDFASITLEVLSYDGRLIKSDYLGYKLAGKVNINKSVSDLPTGNYILRLKYNDVSAVKTFSVVR